MRTRVTVGPVAGQSAAAWLSAAQESLRILKHDAPVDLPWDVVAAFETYLAAWCTTLDQDSEVFVWTDEVDDDVIARVGLHWARIANIARSGRPRGLAAAGPDAAAFYDAVITGIANAMHGTGDATLAAAFEDAVPAFDTVAAAAPAHEPCRVLLIGSDESARLLARVLLDGDATFEVTGEACDRHDALRLARSTKPDVALVDLASHDGLRSFAELIQVLRARCRVVALTLDENGRRTAMSSGASSTVPRSAAAGQLVAALREAGRVPVS